MDWELNSFLGRSYFANILDPDQDGQNVHPDLDQNCDTLILFLKEFFEKVNFEKISRRQQKHGILPSMQRVNHPLKHNSYVLKGPTVLYFLFT